MPVAKTPKTATITNHGLVIAVKGQVVGAITRFGSSQNRNVKPVFEFGSQTVGGGDDIPADPGEPFEIVPGNIGGTELTIDRYDIYTKKFEVAFGTNNLIMLTRQDAAIRFIEFWASPDGTFDFTRIYYGAYFTRLGFEHNAEGDRIRMARASAMFTRIRDA